MAINFPTTGLVAGTTTYTYANHTWLWSGTVWQSVGTVQGAQGVQGLQGSSIQGTQGTQGVQGLVGPTVTLPDITPLDNLQYEFDGVANRFYPKNNGVVQAITNQFTLLITLNGIIQSISFPEVVWGTPFSYDGFTIDSDGYIAFSEAPPAGSTFFGMINVGPTTQSTTNTYPFKAVDILIGAN
jgi:hypothetical protein